MSRDRMRLRGFFEPSVVVHQVEFALEGVFSVLHSDIGHVRLFQIVALDASFFVVFADPVFLDRIFPSGLEHRVPGKFTHIDTGEFVDLSGHRVFFNERFLGV